MTAADRGGVGDADVGRATLRKVSWRLLPLLGLGYGVAYMDRVNISFAALQMNQDLHFSATVYGLGAGSFSLSYCLLEVPSNVLLARFGARRWISRIMLTWGIIAVCMLFVTTARQFYFMRFLLGMAEAGFFPGVLYYLRNWFPASSSGRAISRFYVAVPLGAAFMGAISGPMLNLRGVAGLSGWQWLFLLEGLPAVLLSGAIFFLLPDEPAQARWMSATERRWLTSRVELERCAFIVAAPSPGAVPSSPAALRVPAIRREPSVWTLSICNFLIMGSSYSFAFSAPGVLRGVTQWDATGVGLFMSGTALFGALIMLLNGWHSDRHGERFLHVAAPLMVMAAAMLTIAWCGTTGIILTAYVFYYAGVYAVQAAFWPIPSNALRGPSAAVGLAAIGSIGIFGGFVGPVAWGMARDLTGGYRAGLVTLSVAYGIAASLMVAMARWRRRDATD